MKKKITVPTTPRFIFCNGVLKPISEYSDEDLEKIGQAWIANLFRKARDMKGGEEKEITL
jgi:hypothetical protein